MRYVTLENLVPGMEIEKGIKRDEESKIYLVQKGTVLTSGIIRNLSNIGIKGAYVSIGKINNQDENSVIPIESQARLYSAIQNKDTAKVIEKSKQIASIIYEQKRTNLDMYRMIESTGIEMQSLNICEIALTLAKLDNIHPKYIEGLAVASLLCNIGYLVGKNEIKENKLREELVCKKVGPLYMENPDFNLALTSFMYLADRQDISSFAKMAILYAYITPDYIVEKKAFDSDIDFSNKLEKAVDSTYEFKFGLIISAAMRYEKYLRESKNPFYARNKILEDYKNNKIYSRYGELLYHNVPVFPIDTPVTLSNGDTAIVVESTFNPERPIVKDLMTEKYMDLSNDYLNITITKMEIDGNIIDLITNEDIKHKSIA